MSNVQHVKVWDLGTHTDFSGLFDAGLNFFRKHVAQIDVFAIFTLAHHLDGPNVCDVVGNDFAKLGKMPSVPFSGSHHVIVQLFIQIVQKRHGLKSEKFCVILA